MCNIKIAFTLNRKPIELRAPADISLLRLLREHLDLTGPKPGCEIGECGACSVLLDSLVVNSCQVLAPQVDGREVITIEGIHGPDGGPSDLQQAFLEFGAVQCGYCTPGMVIAAEAFLTHNPEPSREDIQEALSGNLCRCTGYQQIINAIQATAARRQPRDNEGGK